MIKLIPPSEFNKAVYYGMYWDSKCNLWISSNLGLIKYDGRKFKLHRYFSSDAKNIVISFYEYSIVPSGQLMEKEVLVLSQMERHVILKRKKDLLIAG